MSTRKLTINLDSSNRTTGTSHDFVTAFNPPITYPLDSVIEIGLDRIGLSYTWHNISEKNNNNKVDYRFHPDPNADLSTVPWYTIPLPAGNYTYEDISESITASIQEHIPNGVLDGGRDNDGNNTMTSVNGGAVKFTYDSSRVRVFLELQDSLDLRFPTASGTFNQLVGFRNDHIYEGGGGGHLGESTPDITRYVDSIMVRIAGCDGQLVSGASSDVIFKFPVTDLRMSYPFEKQPLRVNYFPLRTNTIGSLRIYITDQKGREIDLNGVGLSAVLFLVAVKRETI